MKCDRAYGERGSSSSRRCAVLGVGRERGLELSVDVNFLQKIHWTVVGYVDSMEVGAVDSSVLPDKELLSCRLSRDSGIRGESTAHLSLARKLLCIPLMF